MLSTTTPEEKLQALSRIANAEAPKDATGEKIRLTHLRAHVVADLSASLKQGKDA